VILADGGSSERTPADDVAEKRSVNGSVDSPQSPLPPAPSTSRPSNARSWRRR
jgi:hypothetical protein